LISALIPITFLRPALLDIRRVISVTVLRVTPPACSMQKLQFPVSDWLRYSVFNDQWRDLIFFPP